MVGSQGIDDKKITAVQEIIDKNIIYPDLWLMGGVSIEHRSGILFKGILKCADTGCKFGCCYGCIKITGQKQGVTFPLHHWQDMLL